MPARAAPSKMQTLVLTIGLLLGVQLENRWHNRWKGGRQMEWTYGEWREHLRRDCLHSGEELEPNERAELRRGADYVERWVAAAGVGGTVDMPPRDDEAPAMRK